MKRVLAVLCILCFCTSSFSGCEDSYHPVPEKIPASEIESPAKTDSKKLLVGFVQISSEPDWRKAQTKSLQKYADEHSDEIALMIADAQHKQENQIKAIQSFIDMGVDVIGLTPVVETGWDAVFKEAREAEIPVVLLEGSAGVSQQLYASFISADFSLEGEIAADELAILLDFQGNVVQLEGTSGVSASSERKKSFEDALSKNYPKIKLLASQSGNFTKAGGKKAMESLIQTFGTQIQGIYAHNDDMMLGAIEAIKEAGLKPGVDIKTVSITGTDELLTAMTSGEANTTIESNSLPCELFFKVCLQLKNNESVDHRIFSQGSVIHRDQAKDVLSSRNHPK